MSVKITFECNGCGAAAAGTKRLEGRFLSFDGKSYGFGRWIRDEVEDVAPEGWFHSAHTQRTYCPKCWENIEND